MEQDQDECAKIVARVLEGDRQAYARLVEEYKTSIYNLAYRMTGNLEDAADLTQDIFIRAYIHLWRYNPEKKFFTWLYTIALNTIKNFIKKNKITQTSDLKENQSLAEQNSSAAQDMDIYLSALDVQTRAFILMKYVQELSFEEISEISGKSISAVKMRIYRGLESLRSKIK
ncbi:MAG TPA: sigma-70 family RNA polymerase sigma factor [Smithellaceae bacterium]|nr:sigma-70 family RNA polymerase sigma factor [Smithellaceae bacterium]HRS89208.1 sigma-70 family RNA polymerase sigma factor [Smithellaceae bacterium]HRV26132.1 sigma-70 family RNA polymerase sigma factor [Smithellaceae bacterium]